MKQQKVFAIGFQKTGTTSLGLALENLGYRVCGYNPFRVFADADKLDETRFKEEVFRLAEQYDAFKDTPWPLFYEEFDQKYPNSKFIHVVRDTDKWINSAAKDFKDFPKAIHLYIYGVPYPKGFEDIFIKRYEEHNKNVLAYFQGRDQDFISLNMDKGEVNWQNICSFLDKPCPDEPWPHANNARDKQYRMFIKKIKDRLKRVFT